MPQNRNYFALFSSNFIFPCWKGQRFSEVESNFANLNALDMVKKLSLFIYCTEESLFHWDNLRQYGNDQDDSRRIVVPSRKLMHKMKIYTKKRNKRCILCVFMWLKSFFYILCNTVAELQAFLNKSDFLNPFQSDFDLDHGAELALVILMDHLLRECDVVICSWSYLMLWLFYFILFVSWLYYFYKQLKAINISNIFTSYL